MSGKIRYIKVSKKDNNGVDITTTLESITEITLPLSTGNKSYPILSTTEYPTFYLYYVNPSSNTDIPSGDKSTVKYDFTGSFFETGSYVGGITPNPINFSSSIKDPLNLFTPTDGLIINTYAQKQFHIFATGSIKFVSSGVGSGTPIFGISKQKSDGTYDYNLLPGSVSSGFGSYEDFLVTGSVTLNPGDRLFMAGFGNAPSGSYFIDSSSRIFISSSAATGTTKEIVIEPFFTSSFYGSDCDVMQGEVEDQRVNPKLQKVDYSTSQTIPVNATVILAGTAENASIPESNYTQLSSINIKYNGSKNQSEKINEWIDKTGTLTDFSQSFNIGNYGKTSPIDSLDTTIYEFNWGGGTTPEILGYGAVKMGKLLQVNTKDSIKTINPSTGFKEIVKPVASPLPGGFLLADYGRSSSISSSVSEYYYLLNGNNPINHEISMFPYPNQENAAYNPVLPSTTKILTTEFGVPLKSSFVSTSSYSLGGSSVGVGSIKNFVSHSVVRLAERRQFNTLNDDYSLGDIISPGLLYNGIFSGSVDNGSTSYYDQITSSMVPINNQLNSGERWFFTFYTNLETPIEGDTLNPYVLNTTPLGQKGVIEIAGISSSDGGPGSNHTYHFMLKDKIDNNVISVGSIKNIGGADGNPLGFLMWKARAAGDNEFVIVQDSITGGVGNGAFTSRYTTKEITENFEDITRTYGSNPT